VCGQDRAPSVLFCPIRKNMTNRLDDAYFAFHSGNASAPTGPVLVPRAADPTHTVPFFHTGAPMPNLMIPGHTGRGVSHEDRMKQRHAAITAVIQNPGEVSQVPLAPEKTGYVASMKPMNTDSGQIKFNTVKRIEVKRR